MTLSTVLAIGSTVALVGTLGTATTALVAAK